MFRVLAIGALSMVIAVLTPGGILCAPTMPMSESDADAGDGEFAIVSTSHVRRIRKTVAHIGAWRLKNIPHISFQPFLKESRLHGLTQLSAAVIPLRC